jgi:hypothetical protein
VVAGKDDHEHFGVLEVGQRILLAVNAGEFEVRRLLTDL